LPRCLQLLLIIALASQSALAEDTAKARDAFLKGNTLYTSKKFKDALAKFEESYAAKPHPATMYNIARCQDQLGDLLRSMTSYKEYLRQSPQADDADEVVKAIASIEGRLQAKGLQHLVVYVEPATAVVKVDGKEIGASPASATLAPGAHAVTISADGFEPYERSFALSASRSMELTVSLSASTPPVAKKVDPPPSAKSDTPKSDTPKTVATTPTPKKDDDVTVRDDAAPAPRKRIFTWVAAGTAGVAAGLGGLFAVLMKNDEKTLQTLDPMRTKAQANALYDGAFFKSTFASAAFITAGVAAAAAVVLFFLEGA
jgi:hypothetical protein